MNLSLTILGSSSAIPISNRNPTSQFLTIANKHFLIDCGEGTQVQIRRNHIGFGRINHIFISHLHGDHFYGLVPLLTSLHLLDRTREMHIYGPPRLEEGVNNLLSVSGTSLKYPLKFHVLNMKEEALIYDDNTVSVHSFPLRHSMPCCGFLFREKPHPRNFRKEVLKKYSIPVAEIRQIKNGADWVNENGEIIPNKELTRDPRPPLSYLYCTDTEPVTNLKHFVPYPPSLMYHEATFSEEHAERAAYTKHSTARQAAKVASEINPKHLLIGHFSVRYEKLDTLLQEAREIFSDTHLAEENLTFHIKNEENLEIEKVL